MSRWKVMKSPFTDSWSVYRVSPDGVSGVLWHPTSEWFDTWAEAIAYADKRSRTVEVTLPRLTALPTGRHIVQRNGLIIEYERSDSYPHLSTGYIAVEPWELRPLAAALLAIEQHKEKA